MTYAIYRKQPDGTIARIGTFTCRGKWHSSVRSLSAAFWAKYPNIPKSERSLYYCAARHRMMGKWVDGERLLMETEDENGN
jgi:hypothetical protein